MPFFSLTVFFVFQMEPDVYWILADGAFHARYASDVGSQFLAPTLMGTFLPERLVLPYARVASLTLTAVGLSCSPSLSAGERAASTSRQRRIWSGDRTNPIQRPTFAGS